MPHINATRSDDSTHAAEGTSDRAAAIVDIVSELVKTPEHDEIPALQSALERIARIADAAVIALRAMDDNGLLQFVAGWSEIPGILDGPQEPLERNGALPISPLVTSLLAEMPVRPLRSQVQSWSAQLPTDIPPSVFCPVIEGGEPTGFLCLVARPDAAWSPEVVAAVAVSAAMLGQFRARVGAERLLARQVAFSNCQLEIAESFLALKAGEEGPALGHALRTIGEFLGAESVALWERWGSNRVRVTQRWLAPGIGDVEFGRASVALDEPWLEMVRCGDGPVQFSASDLGEEAESVCSSDFERDFLLVPTASRSNSSGALLIGTTPNRTWEQWEVSGLMAFAGRVPELRARLALEEQFVAAFHAAPVGVVVRAEDGTLLDCNDAFVEFLGYESKVELIGSAPHDVLWPSGVDGIVKSVFGPEPGTLPSGFELPFRHRQGRVVWGKMTLQEMTSTGSRMVLGHIQDVTDARTKRLELQHLAEHDELTGLRNRRSLSDLAQPMLNGGRNARCGGAIVVIDLDGFKQINDSHGHVLGDELLRAVGSRLDLTAEPGETAVRFGGDEFVIVCEGPIDERAARMVARRFTSAIAEPIDLGGDRIFLGASAGIAVITESDTTIDDIVKRADADMYVFKRAKAPASA